MLSPLNYLRDNIGHAFYAQEVVPIAAAAYLHWFEDLVQLL